MSDLTISTQEDRRTLLSIYASAQLQLAGFIFAVGAAILAELIGVLGTNTEGLGRIFFLSLLPPSLLFLAINLKAYLVQTEAIKRALDHDLPTVGEVKSKLEVAKGLFKHGEPDFKNGLYVLDLYYTSLTRITHRTDPLSRLTWKGLSYVSIALLVVFAVSFLVFILALPIV